MLVHSGSIGSLQSIFYRQRADRCNAGGRRLKYRPQTTALKTRFELLFVDDNSASADALGALAAAMDHEALVAYNGAKPLHSPMPRLLI